MIYIKAKTLKKIYAGKKQVQQIFLGKKLVWTDDLDTIYLILIPGNGGKVYGSGIYTKGDIAEIKAVADKGYRFDKWDDDSIESERRILLNKNTTLSAFFIENLGIINYIENY